MIEYSGYNKIIRGLAAAGSPASSWRLAEQLIDLSRSVSGSGNTKSLEILRDFTDGLLEIKGFNRPEYYSWTRPKYWDFKGAQILSPDGDVLLDAADHPLRIVAHSCPVDRCVDRDTMNQHLHVEQTGAAIPYRTTYYKENWGFCVSHAERDLILKYPSVMVRIDAELVDQAAPYGEAVIHGDNGGGEILISSYICHPGMANNELSGMLVVAWLIRALRQLQQAALLPCTVRFLLAPETFGSIAYIHDNLDSLKANLQGVVVCSCVGDGREISVVNGKTEGQFCEAVKLVAKSVAKESGLNFREYSFLERGADERQYGSPHVDLDVVTLCNTKFGEYPEYHTSNDDLSIISEGAIARSVLIVIRAIYLMAFSTPPEVKHPCEPMLSRVGLYPHTRDYQETQPRVMQLLNFAAYADGNMSLIDMANLCGWTDEEAIELVCAFQRANYLK